MDVYSWLFALIGKLLADSSVPAWLAETIVNALKNVLTAEKLTEVEQEVKELFCAELRKLELANPNSVLTKDVADALCVLICCKE